MCALCVLEFVYVCMFSGPPLCVQLVAEHTEHQSDISAVV